MRHCAIRARDARRKHVRISISARHGARSEGWHGWRLEPRHHRSRPAMEPVACQIVVENLVLGFLARTVSSKSGSPPFRTERRQSWPATVGSSPSSRRQAPTVPASGFEAPGNEQRRRARICLSSAISYRKGCFEDRRGDRRSWPPPAGPGLTLPWAAPWNARDATRGG